MLLDEYIVSIDNTLRKLITMKEYIQSTEDYINIHLDYVRNQLMQFELLLTIASFVFGIFGVVCGIFGMNFPVAMFHDAAAFKWVLIITRVCGIVIFFAFLLFFRYKRLIPV
ncbi:Magnesium transporter MRS2-1 [Sesamum alatum]|uniref:Magnesium transporter MRS2-1 n=1 Tax=Sesamum alatum TaxID=300844 RepID=A0AAE1XMD7_9LAMI|nr:Magnesium transporter MRS2-1 [Sesamum alatum]